MFPLNRQYQVFEQLRDNYQKKNMKKNDDFHPHRHRLFVQFVFQDSTLVDSMFQFFSLSGQRPSWDWYRSMSLLELLKCDGKLYL